MAVRLLDQIKRSHARSLELDALFAAPTVAGLAAALAATDDSGPQADPPVTSVPRTGRPAARPAPFKKSTASSWRVPARAAIRSRRPLPIAAVAVSI